MAAVYARYLAPHLEPSDGSDPPLQEARGAVTKLAGLTQAACANLFSQAQGFFEGLRQLPEGSAHFIWIVGMEVITSRSAGLEGRGDLIVIWLHPKIEGTIAIQADIFQLNHANPVAFRLQVLANGAANWAGCDRVPVKLHAVGHDNDEFFGLGLRAVTSAAG